ncbi:transmembrane emp24 domain-containing protein 5 isoform X2 [Manis javanica]|uniref:transmembrane emp24 domain-containing protein 5 isoform X2 n=1 Tax=Manis javanica TaxID=9974 RepID=UPI00187A5CE2|nr:transmembrane emp24 domain-containing protein 5 isoform X2 [Manis javanica]
MGDKVWLPFPVFLLAALSPVLLPGAACFTPSLDSDFTFTLPAGQKECFYQPMPLKASLEIEYQVLDGAGLDIDFHLSSPEGRTLVFEQRKSDGVHTVETEVGDYMFCFDNTFSTISEKVIFFELILDNMGEQDQEQEDWKKYITGTDMLDMKLEDILLDGFPLLIHTKAILVNQTKKGSCMSQLQNATFVLPAGKKTS